MKDDEKGYNGWTNYATWRVQLELVSDEVNNMLENDPQYFEGKSQSEVADELKDFVEELICDHTIDNDGIGPLVQGYALAFVSDVNWYELAGHAIEEAKQYKGELK